MKLTLNAQQKWAAVSITNLAFSEQSGSNHELFDEIKDRLRGNISVFLHLVNEISFFSTWHFSQLEIGQFWSFLPSIFFVNSK